MLGVLPLILRWCAVGAAGKEKIAKQQKKHISLAF